MASKHRKRRTLRSAGSDHPLHCFVIEANTVLLPGRCAQWTRTWIPSQPCLTTRWEESWRPWTPPRTLHALCPCAALGGTRVRRAAQPTLSGSCSSFRRLSPPCILRPRASCRVVERWRRGLPAAAIAWAGGIRCGGVLGLAHRLAHEAFPFLPFLVCFPRPLRPCVLCCPVWREQF